LRAFGVGRKWMAQEEELLKPSESVQTAPHSNASPPKPLGGLRILQPAAGQGSCQSNSQDCEKQDAA
jgi:hypothetical protein